ncbi:MAG: hypothetical protein U0350_14755 [Caldilineaceae bacterium]
MQIDNCIWLDDIIDKLERKHDVVSQEVEQVLANRPHFRYISKGRRRQNENLYAAYGCTDAGRYLVVFFIGKPGNLALIVSARNMEPEERKLYGKHKSS